MARRSGNTGVAANAEAQLICVRETVTEISSVTAVEVGIVDALAVGMKVGACGGVVEATKKAAELRAAARGGKAAAFSEEIDFGNAGSAAMTDDLNHAGHGVGAIEGAFGAMDDLDFVDIVEREIGEVEVPAGNIYGSAVDEHFGEGGIATINKDGSQPADGAGTREANASLRRKQVRKRDGLTLLDFLAADEVDRRGSPVDFKGLSVCGDDDVGRKRFEIEANVKSVGFAGSEIENGVAGDEGRALEKNMVVARRNREKIGAVRAGNRRPDGIA